jgi:hypothetical protein
MTTRSRSIGDLTQGMLLCRVVGHSWEPQGIIVKRFERRKAYEASFDCSRCHTIRSEVVGTREGALVHRSYTYVEGYGLDLSDWHGDRKAMRSEIRVELFGQLATRRRLRAVS